MSVEVRSEAKRFAEVWKNRGYEKGETQSFWLSLLRDVFRVEHPDDFIKFEEQVRLDHTSFMDGHIETTHVLIEQKSLDKDLNKPIKQSDGSLLTPFQQAKRYAAELPYSMRPRWIVLCNFKSFLVYDMEQPNGEPEEILLENLEKEYYRLQFLVDEGNRNLKKEQEVSVKAGELVGKLYDALLNEYKDADESSYHSLNVLCVRLVFCFYAEDAGLFGRRNMFHDYMKQFDAKHWRKALIELFEVLDTPEEERDKYIEADLGAFPYVNGGLFADRTVEVPNFTDGIINIALEQSSEEFDWSVISPTIFGAVFESTLNPETRRAGGMHYTSVENIMKVISPLFLDDLSEELEKILQIKVDKTRNDKLRAYQNKLASLNFLDPAAGSCNFLTETYICLRRLENKVLEALYSGQVVMGDIGGESPIKVGINQLHGIEINDFACTVGKTALWIAESQMMKETEDIIHMNLDFLPLKSQANIVCGNALRMNWEDVVSKDKLDFILGNPPFVGTSYLTDEQRLDMDLVWANTKRGKLDFVSCWYVKATDIIKNTKIKVAFVSTNSITQGEQATTLWKKMFDEGVHIFFAYRTFRWDSEATSRAQVHCVIIGFTFAETSNDKYIYEGGIRRKAKNINGYLLDAPTILIEEQSKPIIDVPAIVRGSQATDNGYYLFNSEEKEKFLSLEPNAEKHFKRFMMGREFINNIERWCLWMPDILPAELKKLPHVYERVEKVRDFRLSSANKQTKLAADTPWRFGQYRQPAKQYIAFAKVSSERRRYIPFGFMTDEIIPGDKLFTIPDATIYHFGVLTSNVHMAWMRTVCGRMKSDYSYSTTIVYNTFPWPKPTEAQKAKIEQTAQAILDTRAKYPDSSLADLYDEVLMPPELRTAHQKNDRAVMEAYGFWGKLNSESECVAELMKMYQKLTEE